MHVRHLHSSRVITVTAEDILLRFWDVAADNFGVVSARNMSSSTPSYFGE
jgi:hypothetical protein